MREILDAATHLFLGACCPSCGKGGLAVCESCRSALSEAEPHAVARSGLDVSLVAANDYRPLLAKIVPAFKDEGAWHLAPLLRDRLVASISALGVGRDVVLVPVPSLPSAVRARGFDHSRDLVKRAARALGLPWMPALRRLPSGLDQRRLGGVGRRLNLQQRMASVGRLLRLDFRRVILCDDVVTTGGTLTEAVRCLREVGVAVVGAAVVADADRRREQDSSDKDDTAWPEWVTLRNGDASGPGSRTHSGASVISPHAEMRR